MTLSLLCQSLEILLFRSGRDPVTFVVFSVQVCALQYLLYVCNPSAVLCCFVSNSTCMPMLPWLCRKTIVQYALSSHTKDRIFGQKAPQVYIDTYRTRLQRLPITGVSNMICSRTRLVNQFLANFLVNPSKNMRFTFSHMLHFKVLYIKKRQ